MAVAQLEDLTARFRETKLSAQDATQLQEWLDQGGLTGLSDQLALELQKKGAPAKYSRQELNRAVAAYVADRYSNVHPIENELSVRESSWKGDLKLDVETGARLLAGLGYVPNRVTELTDAELHEIFMSTGLDFNDAERLAVNAFTRGLIIAEGNDEIDLAVKAEIDRRIKTTDVDLERNVDSYYRYISGGLFDEKDPRKELETILAMRLLEGAGYSWSDVQKFTRVDFAYLRSRFKLLYLELEATPFEAGLMT